MKLPIRVKMASEVFGGVMPDDFDDYVDSVVDANGQTVCYTEGGYFKMPREVADLIVAAVNAHGTLADANQPAGIEGQIRHLVTCVREDVLAHDGKLAARSQLAEERLKVLIGLAVKNAALQARAAARESQPDNSSQMDALDPLRPGFEKWASQYTNFPEKYDRIPASIAWKAAKRESQTAHPSAAQWADVYYFARAAELAEFIERAQAVFDAAQRGEAPKA